MNNYYCTYSDYSVLFLKSENKFRISYKAEELIKDMTFSIILDGNEYTDFEAVDIKYCFWNEPAVYDFSQHYFTVLYKDKNQNTFELSVCVNDCGVKFINKSQNAEMKFTAHTICDENWRAMSDQKHKNIIRTGHGPTASKNDNMLFDKSKDRAIKVYSKQSRIKYNRDTNLFDITALLQSAENNNFCLSMMSGVYSKNYNITYHPLNTNTTFKRPPVGWMTWYAVMFDASEKAVLENASWLSKNLKDYGAVTIWVDWEWYHKDKTGVRDDGCDTFNPDKAKYPNGLKYLSDEIKKLHLIPSLWLGYTHDPAENSYIKENPDVLLVKEPNWCGQYFFDFSNPKYLEEFLPMAIKQVFAWGYEAIKYDTLPISIEMHEKYHSNMHNPSLTTKDVFRNMLKKTRELVGKDTYMLSCCSIYDSDILWGCDFFEAARIGGDIFSWQEFIKGCVLKTMRYYPLHNVVFYNDPDNVILREYYNTFEQAKSRLAFVSMLGLPVTFGDHLPDLPADRVDLMKHSIPVIDIHPKDIYSTELSDISITNLAVEKGFESYNIVSVFNLEEKEKEYALQLDADLEIEGDRHLVYEFYSDEFTSIHSKILNISLKPCETKIFCIKEKKDIPQIVSTSRHITQGALEIKNSVWNGEELSLSVTSELTKCDNYVISLYVPEGYVFKNAADLNYKTDKNGLLKLSITPDKNETKTFKILFNKA